MTQNTSGIVPLDRSVLVYPPKPKEKIGSILLADTTKDRDKYAAVTATVIQIGDNAFMEWGGEARKPKPGDVVMIAQYAGLRQKGKDEEEYTVLQDGEVLAILEEVQ